jgi:hypothetical protein
MVIRTGIQGQQKIFIEVQNGAGYVVAKVGGQGSDHDRDIDGVADGCSHANIGEAEFLKDQ